MTSILIVAWLCWCLALLALWLAAPLIARHAPGPTTNGLRVFVPPGLPARLTAAELDALVAHERGHIAHGHVFANFMRACLFMPRCRLQRLRQEQEADDFACRTVRPEVLAAALRKLSFNDLDWHRAARLDRMA